jgi:hypothetical protein
MVAAAAAGLLVLSETGALAHQSSVVYSDLQVSGHEVLWRVQIASGDLFEALGTREITPQLLRAQQETVYAYVRPKLAVENGGRACEPQPAGFDVTEKTSGFFAGLRLRFVCARQVEHLVVRYHLFFDLDPRHQGFARLDLGDGVVHEFVFRRDARSWDLARSVGALGHAWEYLQLGVEHIFTGYDHILFLVGLLVVAGVAGERARGLGAGFRYTLKIVTAFTLAHSITLICAALGLVSVPTRLSESGIALSIAYVGLENLAIGDPRYRWLLTFGFGLVHGFGFATVLREVGLPQTGLVLSLVSFNLGVEVGQLCIVALIFPLLHLAARRDAHLYRRVILQGGSVFIVAFGMLWFVERAFGLRLLGGRLGG